MIPDLGGALVLDDSEPPTPSQIVELRRYRLRPGGREILIELFDRELVESQEKLGMRLLGQFRDIDDPDSFVWLRGFSDMESRRRGLEAFYGGPIWRAHAKTANDTMLDSDNVLLLKPVQALDHDGLARATRGAAAIPPGLIVVTIYPLRAPTAEDFPEHFLATVQPQLEGVGMRVIGTYCSEHSANTFPALPVREGENVFVCMTIHPDQPQHLRQVEQLESSTKWLAAKTTTHADWLTGRPETLRLTPTARSRLHA